MLIMAYISYEGETLTFPGKGSNWFFSLGAGLAERLPFRRQHLVLPG